ncbi:inner membrane protein involved in colicin E2 resistance [Lysinibacillus parviboronicapiens]|uniref:Inner membrane protein involved in colicin E2 resistance n=1 Tax=Lysinibacillus parviboronicapiens TaxID=436516 RepID=A0ABV2PG35_9BACI
MGFWYFLLLFLGLFLVMKGLFMKKPSLVVHKIGFVIVGLFCMSLSFFYVLTRKCGNNGEITAYELEGRL